MLVWGIVAGSCATATTTVVTATPTAGVAAVRPPDDSIRWSVRVLEHVDLWLHGFALLQVDSSAVPLFRPGYRERVGAERARLGVVTGLDRDAPRLSARFAANPGLANAHFVAQYFDSWPELRAAAERFIAWQGDARRAPDVRAARDVAVFAAYFPRAADREWLDRFLAALEEERRVFFSSYWLAEQRARGAVVDRIRSLWFDRDAARFAPFLRNALLGEGEIVPALSLAGEGRTLAVRNRPASVAVGLPDDVQTADEAMLVFAHEIVGPTANVVVDDETSPAEKRSGVAGRYASLAAVRGGELLLRRVAPELSERYMRYYLSMARVQPGSGDLALRFARTFPLPERLLEALDRQIEVVLGGI